jgi:hypothetical protein
VGPVACMGAFKGQVFYLLLMIMCKQKRTSMLYFTYFSYFIDITKCAGVRDQALGRRANVLTRLCLAAHTDIEEPA